jgi:hypothetical protein
MLSCAIAAKSDKVRLAFALKFGKSLDCRKRQIFVQESPLLSRRRGPSFSKLFLGRFGRFQWLGAKKIWKPIPQDPPIRVPFRRQPAIASYVANYNRSGGFEEEFCSIKPLLPLRLRRISSLIS